jgi:Tat protein secretion system quality control protein TatD with DNase activity
MKKRIVPVILILVLLLANTVESSVLDRLFDATGIVKQSIQISFPEAASVELIDIHAHLNHDTPREGLIEKMNQSGVTKIVLMPRSYKSNLAGGLASDEQVISFSQQYPGRVIPFIGGQRDELGPRSRIWNESLLQDGILAEFEEKLSSGKFYGLGEFILRHHSYQVSGSNQGGNELDIPADTLLMKRISKLAAKYKVPLVLHAEAEPHVVEAMKRLIISEPGTTYVWAHNCGRQSAEQLRIILNQHSNLMCDLSNMFNGPKTSASYGKPWPRATEWIFPVQDDNGAIVPDMKVLFEEHPERFLGIGSDGAHTPNYKHYEYRIKVFRVLLMQLSPEVAKKIAFENADRLFAR